MMWFNVFVWSFLVIFFNGFFIVVVNFSYLPNSLSTAVLIYTIFWEFSRPPITFNSIVSAMHKFGCLAWTLIIFSLSKIAGKADRHIFLETTIKIVLLSKCGVRSLTLVISAHRFIKSDKNSLISLKVYQKDLKKMNISTNMLSM